MRCVANWRRRCGRCFITLALWSVKIQIANEKKNNTIDEKKKTRVQIKKSGMTREVINKKNYKRKITIPHIEKNVAAIYNYRPVLMQLCIVMRCLFSFFRQFLTKKRTQTPMATKRQHAIKKGYTWCLGDWRTIITVALFSAHRWSYENHIISKMKFFYYQRWPISSNYYYYARAKWTYLRKDKIGQYQYEVNELFFSLVSLF